jgi:hypothetical protein
MLVSGKSPSAGLGFASIGLSHQRREEVLHSTKVFPRTRFFFSF